MGIKFSLLNFEFSKEPPVYLISEQQQPTAAAPDEYSSALRQYLLRQMPGEDPQKIDYIVKLIDDFDASGE